MIIGILSVELYMPGNSSLKQKRCIMKSLKDRVRNKFNVSVAEVDGLDKWQRSVLAIVNVSNSRRKVDMLLCKLVDWIQKSKQAELIDYRMEIL
jgi:hypothetical protein